jgi:hypothetical protein
LVIFSGDLVQAGGTNNNLKMHDRHLLTLL